ncbi:MAG: DUF3025 domain-containing protein, partial [Burkholderiaceae bacterium]|nr:DUF3025 domain-containing protein [Burkholderiaceae bacterium]
QAAQAHVLGKGNKQRSVPVGKVALEALTRWLALRGPMGTLGGEMVAADIGIAALFVDLRPLWNEAHLVLFGHALLEKLVSPRKSMVAHVYQAPQAIKKIAKIDEWLAQSVDPQVWAAKPFAPLPVLGVPGWWPCNEALDFYDDVRVFRPPRDSREYV